MLRTYSYTGFKKCVPIIYFIKLFATFKRFNCENLLKCILSAIKFINKLLHRTFQNLQKLDLNGLIVDRFRR